MQVHSILSEWRAPHDLYTLVLNLPQKDDEYVVALVLKICVAVGRIRSEVVEEMDR